MIPSGNDDPVCFDHPNDDPMRAYARMWDEDDEARAFANGAFISLQHYVDLTNREWTRRRVLDVGCGTGLIAEQLAPLVANIVAVDNSPDMLAVLRDKSLTGVQLVHADICDVALADESWFRDFDLVLASCVFGVLSDCASTMALLVSAMNPGAVLVLWDWLLVEDDDDEDDHGLTLPYLSHALRSAGLTKVRATQIDEPDFGTVGTPVVMGVAEKPLAERPREAPA